MLNFILGALAGAAIGFWACAMLAIEDDFGGDWDD
jgi:hypothetical protein